MGGGWLLSGSFPPSAQHQVYSTLCSVLIIQCDVLFLIAAELALILQHVCNILAPEGLHTNTFLVPEVWVVRISESRLVCVCQTDSVHVCVSLHMCVCLYGCVCVHYCALPCSPWCVCSLPDGVALIWELGSEVGTHKLGPGSE